MSIIFRVTPHNSVPTPMVNEKGKTAEAEYRGTLLLTVSLIDYQLSSLQMVECYRHKFLCQHSYYIV